MYQNTAQGLASLGRNNDSMLVHMTPREVGGLQQLAMSAGGSLTINPQTGLPEAGFLSSMLPMLAAAAAIYFTGGAAAPAVAGAEAAAAGAAASSIPASLVGAGAGALTGALTNKKNPLMGAITGGISGYGMGGVGEGLAQAGAAAAPELNAAAEIGKRATGIDELVRQAAVNPEATMTPEAYRGFLTQQVPSTVSSSVTPAELAKFQASPAGQKLINDSSQTYMARGLKGLSSEQGRDAFIGTAASKGVPATGLGGGVSAAAKGIGLAAPLIASAMEPGNFTPPPVKPTPYVKTTYNPTQYDPVTGTYSNPSYGPYSTYYAAQGGAVGYAGGGPAYYPLTADPVNVGPSPGGLGGRGDKPTNPREIYGDDSGAGIYDDKAGEGPYSDSAGVGINQNTPSGVEGLFAKTSATTLARYKTAKNAAKQAAALKELRKRASAVDDYGPETTSAAQGGLMGLNTYAAGGKLLRGPGDGMSDSIPAVINGAEPQRAALADGEFVIPADVVSHLGNGSTEAGSKRLYSMMDKVRRARTGNPKQGKQINPDKFMPA